MRRMAAAVVLGALVGCGGELLSPKDERVVAAAIGDLSFCPDRFPASERPSPQKARKHVERLTAIYRKDPGAIQNAGQEEELTMRELLEATARNLTRDRCDPALVRRINDALGE